MAGQPNPFHTPPPIEPTPEKPVGQDKDEKPKPMAKGGYLTIGAHLYFPLDAGIADANETIFKNICWSMRLPSEMFEHKGSSFYITTTT
jgi:hypothetical protein